MSCGKLKDNMQAGLIFLLLKNIGVEDDTLLRKFEGSFHENMLP